jgi:hypothetical protein
VLRLYFLPVFLTAGLTALVICFIIIGVKAPHADVLSGVTFFAPLALPFSAVGLAALMPVVELLRRQSWSTMRKASIVWGAGALLGAGLLFWFSWALGAFSGALSAGIWLGLNWQRLRSTATARPN